MWSAATMTAKRVHQPWLQLPIKGARVQSYSSHKSRNREVSLIFLRLAARYLGHLAGHIHRNKEWHRYGKPAFLGMVLSPGILFGGYMLAHMERIPLTNRIHFVCLSEYEEMELSEEAVENVLKEEGKSCLVSSDPVYKAVHEITQHLVEYCKDSNLVDADKEYKLYVIESPIANAFVVPNGTIFVYTGILEYAKTYGGLATILGHEISHALARHTAEKLGHYELLMLIYEFIRGFTNETHDQSRWKRSLIEFLAISVLQVVVPLAFSRNMEREADRMGMILAARAGYDPREASLVWERMSEKSAPEKTKSTELTLQSKALLGDLFSTHPSNESRTKDLRIFAKTLMDEYDLAIDQLAFSQLSRDSSKLLPQINTPKTKIEDWAAWEFTSQVARTNASLMGGSKGAAIREFLKEVGIDESSMIQ